MNTLEADQEYQRTEARYRELSEDDKKFEQLTKEFFEQTTARKELAEFMHKHRLRIRSVDGGLEIIQETFFGEPRVIYSTREPILTSTDLVSGGLG